MYRVAFFNTKSYDQSHFSAVAKTEEYRNFQLSFFENKLDKHSAVMTKGFDAVCAFVNDDIGKKTIDELHRNGVKLLAMRCAGYNNVDLDYAKGKILVCRVPAYSPESVAEHAFAMLLTLTRKLQHAYVRVREFNFSLSGLEGTTMCGKTIGLIGYGRIGKAMANIAKGFGMKVLVYDKHVTEGDGVEFKDLDSVLRESDFISLHCPLTDDTFHIINLQAIKKMKGGAVIINTSRGALIDSTALLGQLKTGKLAGACLDVYEDEAGLFYNDFSNRIMLDDNLVRLIAMHNVLVTGHQAFLTDEALTQIALTTMDNIKSYFEDNTLKNSV